MIDSLKPYVKTSLPTIYHIYFIYLSHLSTIYHVSFNHIYHLLSVYHSSITSMYHLYHLLIDQSCQSSYLYVDLPVHVLLGNTQSGRDAWSQVGGNSIGLLVLFSPGALMQISASSECSWLASWCCLLPECVQRAQKFSFTFCFFAMFASDRVGTKELLFCREMVQLSLAWGNFPSHQHYLPEATW